MRKHKAKIELNTTVKDLLSFYREERRMYGQCPNCGEAFRLSDARLTYGKEPPKDLLTQMRRERECLRERLDELNESIEGKESEHSYELERLEDKWRNRVDVEVDRHLQRKIRDIRQKAINQSRVSTLGKTIERVAPMFSGFGHHPSDVRPIFEPIDFVVFEGLFHGEVTDLIFIEFKTGGSRMTPVQKTIRDAVHKKRIHFEELRMSTDAIRRMVQGSRTDIKKPFIEGK